MPVLGVVLGNHRAAKESLNERESGEAAVVESLVVGTRLIGLRDLGDLRPHLRRAINHRRGIRLGYRIDVDFYLNDRRHRRFRLYRNRIRGCSSAGCNRRNGGCGCWTGPGSTSGGRGSTRVKDEIGSYVNAHHVDDCLAQSFIVAPVTRERDRALRRHPDREHTIGERKWTGMGECGPRDPTTALEHLKHRRPH